MVVSHLQARRASEETLQAAHEIASLTGKRNALIQERDAFLKERNQVSATIGKLMRQKDELTSAQEQELEDAKQTSTQAAEGAAKVEAALEEIQTSVDNLLAGIPNLLEDIVPDGDDENENEEVSKWGDIVALPQELGWPDDFEALWHDDVALQLQGYQAEAAVKISGARFVALSGGVAQLERAIAMFSWICIPPNTDIPKSRCRTSSAGRPWKGHLSYPSFKKTCLRLLLNRTPVTERTPF